LGLIHGKFCTTDHTVCGPFNILHCVTHGAMDNQGTDEEKKEFFTPGLKAKKTKKNV